MREMRGWEGGRTDEWFERWEGERGTYFYLFLTFLGENVKEEVVKRGLMREGGEATGNRFG
jgi:hypothetical protein